jgi:hypothetical protein
MRRFLVGSLQSKNGILIDTPRAGLTTESLDLYLAENAHGDSNFDHLFTKEEMIEIQ